MNRRGFLASLGAAFATAAITTKLATTKLLPPELTSLNNELMPALTLSEHALEDILIEINNVGGVPLRINTLIVAPGQYAVAKRLLGDWDVSLNSILHPENNNA